ncbi:hypothetical protein GN958_ATG13441 [Phytophthora infestans]|uniref:Uncharacterized protein n=1 Tax=Phytophthora infestans TaxID=4787 RepID=A0A8S9UEI5_PHYIN|nr:hypothetical protein GN958_ATG13441 [Phytophthora infestans]
MNAVISDGEMANIILQGVEATHRNVVRLFNSPNMVGAANLEPDLDEVLNSLRGKAERDKSVANQLKSSDEDGEKPVKAMQTRQYGQEHQKKRPPHVGGGVKERKESRTCFYCKKKEHLRAQY